MKKVTVLNRFAAFCAATGWTEISEWDDVGEKYDGMVYTVDELDVRNDYMSFKLVVGHAGLMKKDFVPYASDFTVYIAGEFHEDPKLDILKITWEYMPSILVGKSLDESFTAICEKDDLPYESDITEFIKVDSSARIDIRKTRMLKDEDRETAAQAVFAKTTWAKMRDMIDARFNGVANFLNEAQAQMTKVRKIILLKLERTMATMATINTAKED